jgi:hypothetical protein
MNWTVPDVIALPTSYYDTLTTMLKEEEDAQATHGAHSHI